MKKIPTLFKRDFSNGKVIGITDEVISGMEWVLEGEGVATVKYDGSCCAIINGEFYKRFDAKPGRKIPEGAIPCCEPDKITGHHPHWVKVDANNPADKWFVAAYERARFPLAVRNLPSPEFKYHDGTFEAVGKHFNGNPYNLNYDVLVPHGFERAKLEVLTFEGIKKYLKQTPIEGIVFWKDKEPKCKIKRTDFGFDWPIKEENDD